MAGDGVHRVVHVVHVVHVAGREPVRSRGVGGGRLTGGGVHRVESVLTRDQTSCFRVQTTDHRPASFRVQATDPWAAGFRPFRRVSMMRVS